MAVAVPDKIPADVALLKNMPPLDAVKFAFVPPLAKGKIPVTPVVKGSPEQLVKVPETGVPRTAATNVIPLGNVELIEGIPAPDVTNTPELAVAKALITLAELAQSNVLTAFVVG